MLTGLGHGAVIGTHYEDGTIHLGSTGDHVLDVICVTGAVHMGIVSFIRFVFHVCGGYRNAPRLFLGGFINLIEGYPGGKPFIGQTPGNGRGEGGLAVIYVSNSSYIHVGFGSYKLFLSHRGPPLLFFLYFSLSFHRYTLVPGHNGKTPY